MREYAVLIAALACAVPYGYVIIAIFVLQPRQIATYITVVGLLALWPSCAMMSIMQLVPVFAMSAWWWSCDFSAVDAIRRPLRFERPMPVGLIYMLLATILAVLVFGAYAYSVSTTETQRNTLLNNESASCIST